MIPFNKDSLVTQYARRLFPSTPALEVERVAEGVSSIVYRISTGTGPYFLRICPETTGSLAAEAAAHYRMAELGLHVPRVLHFEPYNPLLQRSVMLLSAIPGHTLKDAQSPLFCSRILSEAGRELAQINRIPVQGYGWANQATASELAAEYATAAEWLQSHFAAELQTLAHSNLFTRENVDQLFMLLEHTGEILKAESAVLAHGDFDLSHIYFERDTYTGIIDFGEMRGAHWLYDLGHFAIEHRALLPCLLAGYQQIRPLSREDKATLRLTSLLIAARRIGRRLQQSGRPLSPDIECVTRELATGWSD